MRSRARSLCAWVGLGVVGMSLECGSAYAPGDDGETKADAASDTTMTVPDAPTLDAALDRPFSCAEQNPKSTFCDDFDDGGIPAAGWASFFYGGGDAGLDSVIFRSPPRSYVGYPGSQEAGASGSAGLKTVFIASAFHLTLAFDCFIEDVPATGGSLVLAAVDLADNYGVSLSFEREKVAILNERVDPAAPSIRHVLDGFPQLHAWTHVTLALDFVPNTLAASSAQVAFDGAVAADGLPLVAHQHFGPPALVVGPLYVVGPYSGAPVHIDNVSFNMKN